MRKHHGPGGLRGLLRQRGGPAAAGPLRVVLVGRPRLSRRRRVGLLRRAGRRLATGGRREFAGAQVEALISRHPEVMLAAVYAVPDPRVGDEVMACVQLRPGSAADAQALDAHLRKQPELGTKWLPRFLRITSVDADDGHEQSAEAPASWRAVGMPGPRLVASEARRRPGAAHRGRPGCHPRGVRPPWPDARADPAGLTPAMGPR